MNTYLVLEWGFIYHVAVKMRKTKYIFVFDGIYEQFVYFVNHIIGL
jgi:hypothetical protein